MSAFPTAKSVTDVAQLMQQSKVTTQSSQQGSTAFLKFDFKTGEFSFGREAEDVTDEELLVNPTSFQHGWVVWANGSPTKVMAPFYNDIPARPEPIAGNEPTEARGVSMAFTDDPDTTVVFESNSYGGRTGLDSLLQEIQLRSQTESEFIVPRIQLTSTSYSSKKAGGSLVFNPVFHVLAWHNMDGSEQGEATAAIEEQKQEDVQGAQVEEAPKRRRRKTGA